MIAAAPGRLPAFFRRSGGSLDRLGVLVELALDFVPRRRRQPPDEAVHASLGEARERLGLARRAQERDRDRSAARLAGAFLKLGDAGEELSRVADPVRKPPVAERDDALEHPGAVAADEHRRMRLLDGLRPGPDRVEVD